MRKLVALLLSAFALTFTACDEEPTAAERASAPKQAFDLVGLLDQELKTLASQPVSVKKTVSEAGQTKETKVMEKVDWSAELASFAEADLNKPALRGLFTEEQTPSAGGQSVKTYTAKDGARTNVKKAVYTFNSQGQLLQVDATIRQENMLFETLKEMHLAFDPASVPSLRRYRLDETQELLFMRPDQYSVEGELLK